MPGYLFWFTLRKADGVDLGLQLCDTHARALCIRHVWPYGAVHSWNKLCAGARPEVEIKASKQQNILKGNCEQKVDRNLVCRLDSAMTPMSAPALQRPKACSDRAHWKAEVQVQAKSGATHISGQAGTQKHARRRSHKNFMKVFN